MSKQACLRSTRMSRRFCWKASPSSVTRRNLHEETPLANKTLSPRQAIIHVHDPEKLTSNYIAKLVARLRDTHRSLIQDPVLVVLGTPKLARFLEDTSFIPQLLETFKPLANVTDQTKFDVIYGCVDGIAPAPHLISQSRGGPTLEGFTLLYGDSNEILQSSNAEIAKDNVKPGSITISASGRGGFAATLPLANTIFTNGRFSTLFKSEWRRLAEGYKQHEAPAPLSSVTINAFGHQPDFVPQIYVPALPLTYAREITEGYGNIVKRIKFQGDPLPASLELETKVPEFLRKALNGASSIDIWALLIPKDAVQKSIVGKSSTVRLPGYKHASKERMDEYKEIGYWIARGARLCRVQSGGGGWGAKAGLLSLDPETQYNTDTDISFEEISLQRLGDVAKEDQYVQFFTSRTTRTRSSEHKMDRISTNPLQAITLLGTAESSIDFVPGELSDAQKAEEIRRQRKLTVSAEYVERFHNKVTALLEAPFPVRGDQNAILELQRAEEPPELGLDAEKPSIKAVANLRQGVFGFVSQGGMYVEQNADRNDGTRPTMKSKIDVPNSFVYRAFGETQYKIRKKPVNEKESGLLDNKLRGRRGEVRIRHVSVD